MEEQESQFFWLDGFEGTAMGGYFIRNSLCEFLKVLEESNLKPVAIKYDGTWNLEILVETK